MLLITFFSRESKYQGYIMCSFALSLKRYYLIQYQFQQVDYPIFGGELGEVVTRVLLVCCQGTFHAIYNK